MISEMWYEFWHFFDRFRIVQALQAWVQDDNTLLHYLKIMLVGGFSGGLGVIIVFVFLGIIAIPRPRKIFHAASKKTGQLSVDESKESPALKELQQQNNSASPQSRNLHPMVFVFNSTLRVSGNTIEKLGISGDQIDIFEPSTMLNRASLDVDECKFKIPLDEEDLQDFEWYKEPSDILFKNFEYAVSLFWNMQRGLQEYNDGFDEEDIDELAKYSNTINMYLEPKGISARITSTGWSFKYNDTYITLEEVIRIVYAGKLKPIKDEEHKTSTPTPLQSQPKPSTTGAAQNTPTIPREPILVFAPYAVDYIITQFIDSDFCFDEVLGVADEARKDLTKYTAIGSWVDEKDPIMRYMEVCNNDITFYKFLKSPAAMLSFKITEKEKY